MCSATCKKASTLAGMVGEQMYPDNGPDTRRLRCAAAPGNPPTFFSAMACKQVCQCKLLSLRAVQYMSPVIK